jgi:hypothetical protein
MTCSPQTRHTLSLPPPSHTHSPCPITEQLSLSLSLPLLPLRLEAIRVQMRNMTKAPTDATPTPWSSARFCPYRTLECAVRSEAFSGCTLPLPGGNGKVPPKNRKGRTGGGTNDGAHLPEVFG